MQYINNKRETKKTQTKQKINIYESASHRGQAGGFLLYCLYSCLNDKTSLQSLDGSRVGFINVFLKKSGDCMQNATTYSVLHR